MIVLQKFDPNTFCLLSAHHIYYSIVLYFKIINATGLIVYVMQRHSNIKCGLSVQTLSGATIYPMLAIINHFALS